jgi:apolipoprotein N-acyltransferase
MTKYKAYAFSLFGGILYALGYPSFLGESLLITPIIGMGILFHYVLKIHSLKSRIFHLLSFNLGFNYMGFYWIIDTLQEFGHLPFIIAALLSGLFTFIITPHLWAGVLLIHFVFHKKIVSKQEAMKPGIHAFLLAAFLTTMEYYTPQQFDVFLGQPWIALSKYLGYASIAGLPIYSFFSYIIVFEGVSLFHKKGASKFNIITTLLFIFSNPFLISDTVGKDPKELNIRLVQANISNFLKTDSEKGTYASVSQVIGRYKELSLERTPFEEKLDLIIWPETAYPYAIPSDKSDIQLTILPPILSQIAKGQGAQLFIGGYDQIQSSSNNNFYQTEYNTTFHINSSGQLVDTYHKQILIPFGETLPFGPLNEYLSTKIDNISFFSVGEKFTLFKLESGHKLISSICYELLKPQFIREYLNSLKERPHAMVNLTNDSWYGKTAEPEQHLFLAKWRAVEFALPIIRSTNTGISSVINADGTESKRLGVFQTGNLDLKLNLGVISPTIFQLYGFATILPLWIIYLIFHGVLLKLRKDE